MWICRELSKINVSETDFTKVAQSYELDCKPRIPLSGGSRTCAAACCAQSVVDPFCHPMRTVLRIDAIWAIRICQPLTSFVGNTSFESAIIPALNTRQLDSSPHFEQSFKALIHALS